ncbi:haloacid dehalogenase-like hydrolase [Nocardia colli]|uniref:haloacid dehalogenase-like hydrolase n=1 Tax=Nocardia colli TaxID=2545717 RepID=UPI0035DECBDC
MQDPLFAEYNVDSREFWAEVTALVDYYSDRGLMVSKDTAYLGHILTYVRDGHFAGLTNAKLRTLGARVPLAPGIPDFLSHAKELVTTDPTYSHHNITVEHYVVSTGLRQMIEGNPIRQYLDGIWACELLSDPPPRGFLSETVEQFTEDGLLTQIGYTLDNTTKTRAIFEINKGVNFEPQLDVNAPMSEDERRVPISNMIYIADGPSDVPVFSVLGRNGGKTLGVYTSDANRQEVRKLRDQNRVQHFTKADFTPDTDAYTWLMDSLREIADAICERRNQSLAGIAQPPRHKV